MVIWDRFVSEKKWPLWTLVLVALILYLLNFNSFQAGAYGDEASYMILAQSIATGQGYARINYPSPEPEVDWPFGYPLLLSPLVALWPFNYIPLKLLSVFLTVLALFVIQKYLEFRLTPFYVLLGVALYAVNNQVVRYSSIVMAEAAYVLWSFLALYLVHQFECDRYTKWYQLPLLALTLVAASTTRLIGGSLAIALLLFMVIHRQVKPAILLGVLYTIGMIPHFLLSMDSGGLFLPQESVNQVDVWSNLDIFLPNLRDYLFDLTPQIVFGLLGPTTYSLIATIPILFWSVFIVKLGLLFLLLLGFLRLMKKQLTVGELYFLAYLGVIIIRKYVPGLPSVEIRYLMPLLPLLLLYLIQGLDWAVSGLAIRLTRPAIVPVSVLCLVLPIFAIQSSRDIYNILHPNNILPTSNSIVDLRVGTTWIAAHTEPNAIIMCSEPRAHFLYARRHTMDFPSSQNEAALLEKIKRYQVSYILIGPRLQESPVSQFDGYQGKDILPLLRQNPDLFQLVYESNEKQVWVYQVVWKELINSANR